MNKTQKIKKKGNEGITLIALIVTIIVLIILAGITINLLTGENGILTRAKDASKMYNEAQAREAVQMAVFSLQMELESQGKSVKISDLSKLPEHDSRMEVDVNTNSEEALVTYDSKFVFTLYKNENGNIVIAEQVQEAGKLKPRIAKIEVEEAIIDHIKVKVTASRASNYKYLIKNGTKSEAGSYTEYGENSTGNFTFENTAERSDLVVGATYTIKVIVSNENGDVEETKEVTLGEIEQATGARIEAENMVDGYAISKIVVLPTKNAYKTEYQIGILNIEGTWTEYDSEAKISLNANTTIYYRYTYGERPGNYSEIVIDKIDNKGPEAFTPTITGNIEAKTITIDAQSLDEGVGVDYYEYSITPANSSEASGRINLNEQGKGIKTVTMTQRGLYTVTLTAVDKLENSTQATGSPKQVTLIELYTVTLNANGGKFEDNSSTKEIEVEKGNSITLDTVSKTSADFYKWTTNSNGTGDAYNEGETITINADLTLYAIWDSAVPTVETVTLTENSTTTNLSFTIVATGHDKNASGVEETGIVKYIYTVTAPTGKTASPSSGEFLLGQSDTIRCSGAGTYSVTVKAVDRVNKESSTKIASLGVEGPEVPAVTLGTADLVSDYGEPVTYGNSTTGTNWRLFFADSNNVYLIRGYDDNLKGIVTTENRSIKEPGRSLNSSSIDWTSTRDLIKAIVWLTNPGNWETYKTGPANWAIGTPTFDLWLASWNAKAPTRAITPNVTSDGYIWDAINHPVTGIKNEIYSDNAHNYYIASPSGENTAGMVSTVGKWLSYRGYAATDGYIRPIVQIPRGNYNSTTKTVFESQD